MYVIFELIECIQAHNLTRSCNKILQLYNEQN